MVSLLSSSSFFFICSRVVFECLAKVVEKRTTFSITRPPGTKQEDKSLADKYVNRVRRTVTLVVISLCTVETVYQGLLRSAV